MTRALKQQSAEDTRGKLLKAAVQVFSDRGYEGATVRDICAAAGVNSALVNYYFGDKMELYLAVIRYAIDADAKMALLTQAEEQNVDPCDALRQIIHGIIQRLSAKTREQFGLHLRFLLKEASHPTPGLSEVIEETGRPLYDKLRSLIGRILNLPADHVTTRLCTHSVIGQVSHYSHSSPIIARLWPEMKMSPEQQKMVADHIADFSLAYLRAQASAPTETPSPRRRNDRTKDN